ncbi:unnamed protein product [Owenia fusiformis]|uniref:Uncharacterized protein n=1 Tax=Owenia fusiformis TaxID=6347 RepID=A0A8J1XIQ5_OWEFU|nr:unnamed protein product [Owenia fusiformis]
MRANQLKCIHGCILFISLTFFGFGLNWLVNSYEGKEPVNSYERKNPSTIDNVDAGCWNKDFRKIVGKGFYRCRKGVMKWSRADVIKELMKFKDVYDNRPSATNKWGTRIMHQFGLWIIIRQLDPLYIIESGINSGLGTWMLRQAAPTAKLIMLEPSKTNLIYKDTMNDSVYLQGVNFKDFSEVKWEKYISNMDRSLVFFDDHQSHYKRVKQSKDLGFKHLVFDDNGHPTKGDVYSISQACDAGRCITDMVNEGVKIVMKDNFGKVKKVISDEESIKMAQYIYDSIDTYYQVHPLWNITKARRKKIGFYLLPHDISYKINPLPLLTKQQAEIYQKNFTHQPLQMDDLNQYANMCYIRLK